MVYKNVRQGGDSSIYPSPQITVYLQTLWARRGGADALGSFRPSRRALRRSTTCPVRTLGGIHATGRVWRRAGHAGREPFTGGGGGDPQSWTSRVPPRLILRCATVSRRLAALTKSAWMIAGLRAWRRSPGWWARDSRRDPAMLMVAFDSSSLSGGSSSTCAHRHFARRDTINVQKLIETTDGKHRKIRSSMAAHVARFFRRVSFTDIV